MIKFFKKIYFEISGNCQARCPYCCNGNRTLQKYPKRFIPLEEFKKAICYLRDNKLIDQSSIINLYNWGEPFLHPNLLDILQYLTENEIKYRLSTNAGIYKKIPLTISSFLTRLTITIPGFSQESYNRIHKLNFNEIQNNIKRFAEDIGASKIHITFLVHQFNLNEIDIAHLYFKKMKIPVGYTVAYLNDYNLARDYLRKTISKEKLDDISKDLFLFYIDDFLAKKDIHYVCPQLSILTLDEYCNVLTCCQVPKGHEEYSIGRLFEIYPDEINDLKKNRKICRECHELGIDYWVHTPPDFFFIGKLTGENIRFYELVNLIKVKIKNKVKGYINK